MTPQEAAGMFRAMADRLQKNADEPFGGVFLAIPPDGNAIEMLTLSESGQNLGQFWGTIQAFAATAIRDAEDAARRMRGFGG